ncbi:MAG: cytochrome ubiquinol oxidase subunit I [Planctomycetota bacterium]
MLAAIQTLVADGGLPAPTQTDANLLWARLQMAFTLGVHIVFACLGVGLPVLMLAAEGLGLRRGDPLWTALARRWAKSFAVLFAVGAVSGTVLAFELGLLWPRFMGTFGAVIGLPFTLEGFAFFLEAIFAGIYLYGWDKLSPRAHWWSGVPIALSGAASAWFVVTSNAWMNTPQGFAVDASGTVVDADPIAAMMNAATWPQTTHMLVAAYMVSGFLVAGFYAARLLRRPDSRYDRRALALGLALGGAASLLQPAVGHWAGHVVAATQPAKLAAREGQFHTERRAPLRLGGLPDEERMETPWAIELPGGLSFLAHNDFDAEVQGLEEFPRSDWPPVAIVHVAFQLMVAIGMALLALSLVAGWSWWRRGALPAGRWFLVAVVASAPASALALEAGWVVTEVGRQPWIVQGVMRTEDAVTDAPGLLAVLCVTVAIYAVLVLGCLSVLRILARQPLPEDA